MRSPVVQQRGSLVRLLLSAAALGVATFVACDSPTDPSGRGERVPAGQTFAGSLNASDTVHRYALLAHAGREYAVSFEATEGSIWLLVRDSANGDLRASGLDAEGGPGLAENATDNLRIQADQVLLIELRGGSATGTARYRFVVHEGLPAPESRTARFTIGDTVAGEALDPISDVDEFVASGEEGQEIAGVIHGLNPAGVGVLALSVTDTATGSQLAFSRGGPRSLEFSTATGRFVLPGTRDYRFTVRGLPFGGRYTGPYRFWFHRINRAPETVGATVAVDTEIAGEAIDTFGDVDEFTFSSSAAAEFNVFLQGLAPRPARLEVAPSGGVALAATETVPGDTGLFQHATGRFRVAQAGAMTVRVTGFSDHFVADTGAYRLYVYAVNPLPEHIGSTVTPGDTVTGEVIDLPGDVDEFTFTGSAGDEFNAFLQARNGSPETLLQLEVVDGSGTIVRVAQSVGTDTSMLQRVTGRFALSSDGAHRLRVRGLISYNDRDVGPYRLFLYPVDRRPEMLPDTIAFGDSLTGEGIDVPGDLDEFRFTVSDSSGANLVVELNAEPAEGTFVLGQLVDSSGVVVSATSTYQAATRVAGGRVRLSPGSYILRVDVNHYENRPVLRAAYKIWLYRFDFGPELVADTIALGDTVSAETISPPGDTDVFLFYGVRDQHINVAIQGLSPPSSGGYAAFITGPRVEQGPDPISYVVSPTSSASLDDRQTHRLDLPATGWYRVSVYGASSPEILAEEGPYRLAVTLAGTAPEAVGSALVVGDSVTTEVLDTPGDWDEYTVTATPGEELGLIFQSIGETGFAWIRAADSVSGDSLAGTTDRVESLAGPFRVPPSGKVSVAVFERPPNYFRLCYDPTCGGFYQFTGGAYRFRVIPIDRRPESVPASFAIGDTVRGERLFPGGDLDEFTSTGTPGDTLAARYRLTGTPIPAGAWITFEVIDLSTGALIVVRNLTAGAPEFSSPSSFVVPQGGSYLLRVRGSGTTHHEIGTAPYEFIVTR